MLMVHQSGQLHSPKGVYAGGGNKYRKCYEVVGECHKWLRYLHKGGLFVIVIVEDYINFNRRNNWASNTTGIIWRIQIF